MCCRANAPTQKDARVLTQPKWHVRLDIKKDIA